ncbi:Nif11-like leader peptide family natural product precursor [Desulfopila sp. IMCC35008]|uniref:Nif11-like leader peptide family natural product precursor n=1 Tax=Desulfopila sp. IMCC35008 TaxID=2653858 RepID=UPI0013D81F46|nr:Nif11-like leader peptide family natural product precursor [Desulfopila sp. IMCC35008]
MSKKNVEDFLIAGGSNETLRMKYDAIKGMDEFVATANEDGHDFSSDELEDVLRESGDSFESFGNPSKRMIWWF